MKEDFSELEPCRASFDGEEFKALNTQPGDRAGCFAFRTGDGAALSCLVDIRDGWEHVSVTGQKPVKRGSSTRMVEFTPSWEHMDAIKKLFWEPEETVFQFHPAASLSAAAHRNTLHLWKPVDARVPLPPSHLVDYSADHFGPARDGSGVATDGPDDGKVVKFEE